MKQIRRTELWANMYMCLAGMKLIIDQLSGDGDTAVTAMTIPKLWIEWGIDSKMPSKPQTTFSKIYYNTMSNRVIAASSLDFETLETQLKAYMCELDKDMDAFMDDSPLDDMFFFFIAKNATHHSDFCIANRRKSLNIAKKEFAEKMNTTEKTVYNWERGLAMPSPEKKEKIYSILKMEVIKC